MMGIVRSIRVRLTLWYVLLLAVVIAAFSAGIYLTLRHQLSSNLDSSLETRAATLLEVVSVQDGNPTLDGVLAQAHPDVSEQYARVYDAAGTETFDSSGGAGLPALDGPTIEAALDGNTDRTSLTFDDPFRVRVVPVIDNGGIIGALEVGITEDEMNETLQSLLVILAIAYPVTLVIASAGGVFLANRALSPIDRITRLAGRISAQDLSRRVQVPAARDEVGRLARTFNDMIARLEGAFRRQRQFTADASHELRTPLTAVKGQIEVALSRERDAEAYREVLRSANGEVDRLIRLVGSLLTLARADAGEIPLARERVEVASLVDGALDHVRPRAEGKGLTLSVEAGPGVALDADQDLLLQLLLNLLDNAVKFTESGGSVVAGWEREGNSLRLWVRDTGPGIPAEHLPRVFDRFYRVDSARSRAAGGAGLGLSISRWIAEAHGGTLSLSSEPGAGTTAELRIPLS